MTGTDHHSTGPGLYTLLSTAGSVKAWGDSQSTGHYRDKQQAGLGGGEWEARSTLPSHCVARFTDFTVSKIAGWIHTEVKLIVLELVKASGCS